MAGSKLYLVTMRASSAIRLRPTTEVQVLLGIASDPIQLRIRTLFQPLAGSDDVPREIEFELRGRYDDLDDAIEDLTSHGRTVSALMQLVMNAAIEELQLEYAFDITDSLTEHEFFQNLILAETGAPRISRSLLEEPFQEVLRSIAVSQEATRLFRATAQYEAALSHWRPGHWSMALAHLYMAVEALTATAKRREIERHGSQEDLLREWAIDVKQLDPTVREKVIFQGDGDALALAKNSSDGLEHGFRDMERIHADALAVRLKAARYIREAILKFADVPAATQRALLVSSLENPLSCSRYSKYLRSTLEGPAAAMVNGPSGYATFRLESSLKSYRAASDGQVKVEMEEKVTPILSSELKVKGGRLEVLGPAGAEGAQGAETMSGSNSS
jgi:hypothetical protein